MNRSLRTTLAIGLAVVLAASPACAVTIHVPSEQPTIQAGIDHAAFGDTVLVACDTYYEHNIIMKSGVTLRSATGNPSCVTIDAEFLGRVFECESVWPGTIQGFTIVRGDGHLPAWGGGILCNRSSLLLSDLVFKNNRGDLAAGGLYIASSSAVVERCRFESNESAIGTGAGLHVMFGSEPMIVDCYFEGNHAGLWGGGACVDGASPTFCGCVFVNNDAERGGGIYCLDFMGREERPGGAMRRFAWTPSIKDCTFSGNDASEGGGAIGSEDVNLSVTGSKLIGSTSDVGAGARIWSGQFSAAHCVIADNAAGILGGGIACGGDAVIELAACTVTGNSAGVRGGAIDAIDASSVSVTASTLSDNSALVGGCLLVDSSASATLENSILSFSAQGSAVACAGEASASLTCCDVYGNEGGDWVGCIADQLGVNGNIEADPLFCGPVDGDEPYTLQWNSPCAQPNNPACGLVGARGVGCPPSTVVPSSGEPSSWSAIKGAFRSHGSGSE